jgi:alkylation response protein AidB-like acyl-CoA dehydrogenase
MYEAEGERWLENQNSPGALRVREILAATTPVDGDAASSTIRYPLRWHHLAVVVWYPDARGSDDELPRPQRFKEIWARPPEEYGGQGADAVACCIVIEEVARVCVSSSLIPGVNKLGTIGLILSGSDELKKQVLPTLASGDAMASYALSECEAGSDPASMRTRARADGDDWVLNGSKCWITNGGKSTWYTVMAVTDSNEGAKGISAHIVHQDDPGFTVGPKERKLGIKVSPTTELYFEDCHIPGEQIIGEPGTGFKTALASLDHTRPTIGAQAVGIAQGALDAAVAYTKQRKQFRRPVSDFQGVQFMLADMAMKVEAARLMV